VIVYRKLLTLMAICALTVALEAAPASAASVHDFDPETLAAYVSLRFSSAVPPKVIRRVLAVEGFSRANRDLVAASGATPRERALTAPVSEPFGVSNAQEISRDTLPCPPSDPTPCQLDTQAEPDIAVNPTAPRNLVGVFQQGRFQNGGSVDPGWAASFDGGRTWPYKGDAPGLTVAVSSAPTAGPGAPFERSSDPVVAFDRRHNRVYFNTLSVSDAGCAIFCDSAVTLNVSTNGGKTFGAPRIVHEDVSDANSNSFVFNDKNWIVTDNTRTSPHYGRTYAVWDQVRCAEPSCTAIEQPVMLRYSDNGGKTWSNVIQVTHEQPAQSHQEVGVQPVVLPNGHVVIVYVDATAGAYTFVGSYTAVRSTDGGRTWSSPHLIDHADPYAEEGGSLRAPNVPSATVDGNKIYVAFQDERFTSGRNDILLTSSSDEGRTWSPAVNATPGEANLDHFTPDIAALNGTVHLTYRTRAPGNVNAAPSVDAVYRALRSGVTTSGPVKLYRASNAAVAAFTTIGAAQFKFFGDYAGIAASPTAAHPIWDHSQNFAGQRQNPTNTHQRSFSARVG
jgi:BNR repeat-like domain